MQENKYRRVGVELEYNAWDKVSRSYSVNDLPHGIYNIAELCVNALQKNVKINKWHSTNNNDTWVLKPDSSCGLELCSPPQSIFMLKKDLQKFFNTIKNNNIIFVDKRCSFHVHVEIQDFEYYDLVYLMESWIRLEPIFFILTKQDRWINNYCKALCLCFEHKPKDQEYTKEIVNTVCDNKYYSLNLCNFKKKKKCTVEYRIMGNDACVDFDSAYNWTQLLLNFTNFIKASRSRSNKITSMDFLQIDSFIEYVKGNESIEMLAWIKKRILNNFFNEQIEPSNVIWSKILKTYGTKLKEFSGASC